MGQRMIAFAVVLVLAGCMTGSPMVSHDITYTAKETRSEARHGHLFVDSYEVPWVFSRVSCGQTSYVLRFRSNLWGDDGYWPEVPAYTPAEKGTPIPAGSIKKGYFRALKRPAGTPDDWIWVQWGKDQAAFVAPGRMDALIEEEKIPGPTAGFPEFQRRKE